MQRRIRFASSFSVRKPRSGCSIRYGARCGIRRCAAGSRIGWSSLSRGSKRTESWTCGCPRAARGQLSGGTTSWLPAAASSPCTSGVDPSHDAGMALCRVLETAAASGLQELAASVEGVRTSSTTPCRPRSRARSARSTRYPPATISIPEGRGRVHWVGGGKSKDKDGMRGVAQAVADLSSCRARTYSAAARTAAGRGAFGGSSQTTTVHDRHGGSSRRQGLRPARRGRATRSSSARPSPPLTSTRNFRERGEAGSTAGCAICACAVQMGLH